MRAVCLCLSLSLSLCVCVYVCVFVCAFWPATDAHNRSGAEALLFSRRRALSSFFLSLEHDDARVGIVSTVCCVFSPLNDSWERLEQKGLMITWTFCVLLIPDLLGLFSRQILILGGFLAAKLACENNMMIS